MTTIYLYDYFTWQVEKKVKKARSLNLLCAESDRRVWQQRCGARPRYGVLFLKGLESEASFVPFVNTAFTTRPLAEQTHSLTVLSNLERRRGVTNTCLVVCVLLVTFPVCMPFERYSSGDGMTG